MQSDVTVEVERKWLDLSLAQQAVWLDAKLSGTAVYQLGRWARIAAPLDEAAIRQSISLVMARHDGLRLRLDDELPRQWLDDSVEPPLTVIDLPVGDGDPDAAFQSRVERLFESAFPLGDRPLFRVELIRAGENLSYLLWRFHHLLADYASVSIALTHCFNVYEALTSGTTQDLAPPSSYLKTIAADGAYLESAAYHKDLAYWSTRFDPMPPPLIEDLGSGGGRNVPAAEWTLEGDAFARLQNAAKAAGTTLQRALFALFALTLGRRYGQSDIVSGIALHRRDLANRYTIGMLAGVIAVRQQFDSHWTLEECVQAFSEQLDRDLRHQRLPVDILSRALGLAGTGRAGLFEAAMSYVPNERAANRAGTEGFPVVIGVVTTKEASPISLHAFELDAEQGVNISVGVNTDFLDAAEAGKLLALFQSALESFASAPETRFEELAPVTPAEREIVVEAWNRTDAPFENGTLDGLFSAQARRTPHVIAIAGRDGQELTYAELDGQSTRLARQLAANGVCPERVVGVRLERSSETIIALLAILKAGGVYLPLDPAYPPERLDYMAADAGAMLVLDSIHGLKGEAELPPLADPNRLAYIIYTSGTTGLPKGVAVPHSAPVNLAFARRACHDPLGGGDRVLAGISVGFDVSIGQLLLPLLSGATVVIAGDLKTMGAAEFWAFLAERRVTHINSVPSFLDSILEDAPRAGALALKRLMLGGEALSGALVRRIERTLPGVEVVNMYGPTETCIDATFHVVTPEDRSAAVLPIGRPLSNYRAYVLDSHLEPLGVGVTGELYLGGAGLARGYANAPELTAERFVADPFSAVPGARLYRTGDRARWRADGVIEFLGRVDRQVKIRGFRVEPGEIAAALLSHSGVAQAVVVPRRQNAGPVRLVAYVVPPSGQPIPQAADLRAYLAERLPDYMVPSAFVPIGAIPINRNGKLDEKALPSPDLREGEYVAPRTLAEEKIAALFAEVLGLERCGVTDNFFELGGDSLLAVKLMARMHQQGLPGDVRALFNTPTIAALADSPLPSVPQETAPANLILPGCAAITPDMLPLVKLTQAQIDGIVESVPGGAANIQDIYPLAPLQEGILFQHLMTEQGDPYLAPFVLDFDSRERLDSFLLGLNRLVERHDVLRTAMVWKEVETPLQVVLRTVRLPFEEVALDPSLAGDAVAQLINRFDPRVFRLDLSQAPLLRTVAAYDRNRGRWLLAMLTHHLILDQASMEIVIAELRALMENPQAELPPPVPYRSFIAQAIHDTAHEDHATFFRRLLGDVDEPTAPFGLLDIQADGETGEGELRLEAQLGRRIREQARALGVTPASLFHVGWAAVLGHVCGKSDVVFGTVLMGRMRGADSGRVVGMFINTLPVRVALDKTGAAESVAETHRMLAELLAHEHASLAVAQRSSAVPAPTPLFSSLLNFRHTSEDQGQAKWPGVEMLHSSGRTNYPVAMAVDDGGSGFILRSWAAVAAGPERVCQYLQQAMAALMDLLEHAPETPIESLQVLPRTERHRVIAEWNRTESEFERGTLDGLFAAQARRTPNAVAVVGRDGAELTYAELDAQSTRLARQLAAHGVLPERVVGVHMDRSAETVVALLAILKAGGVYLPLDPSYPKERLDYIAADAGAMLILDSIDGLYGDADLPQINDPERLAYIIYTSGTTGLPKGVAMPHSAPVNLAFARRACHDPLGVGDRVLAGISVGFDVSIGQLLLPLLSGATVVIAGDLKTMGAGEFWSFLAERRVSHINSVPSFFESILDAAPPAATLTLKRLMLGGEALSGTLVARIQSKLPGVEIVNMYGPTEACIDATFHVATPEDLTAAVLPIGRPLSNYRAYVLDSRLQPVGTGVSGELYLGGAGLARGYVNAPDLTAERFVSDPFSPTLGAKLYRTGDRARWRADGCLEFLGRVDRQVKIRGFRVEPGEIAAALLAHPALAQAVVVPRQQNGGSVHLVAYVVPHAGQMPDASHLRAYLAERLPDYMIASAFVSIAAIPLNRNGKLDEKALPSPDFEDGEYVAPRTPTEEKIAALFAGVLGLERCGALDNFFELGGHSLLATSLVSRMRAFGMTVPLRAIFETPTVEKLAQRVDMSLPAADALETITARPRPAEIPLSFPQERIWFVDRLQQDASFNIPVALELRGKLESAPLEQALKRIVDRHESLRTLIALRANGPVQKILAAPALRLPRIDLGGMHSAEAENALQRHLTRLAAYRFDLATALPFEMRLFTLEEQRHVLAVVIHHAAFDGWSASIFLREFAQLYNAFAQGQPDPLPFMPLQYADFALWQREQNREADLAYWVEALQGAPATSELPADASGTPAAESVQSVPLELNAEAYAALSRLARERGASFFMVLHAAFATVLARWIGQGDVVIGTVVANRGHSELESMIGCFVNTLPLRTTVQPGESFAGLLTRVKNADLAAFAHQDLPFEQLVQAVQPERSLQHTPIFQIMLVLQNAPAPAGQFTGLAVEALPIAAQAAQFGLTVTLTEQAGGLSGTFQFSTSRFTAGTIERFARHYRRVLEAVAQNAAQDASRIDVLEANERALVLEKWSGEARPFPQDTLDHLFATQVRRNPTAVAVLSADGDELSYAELDEQSSRLARYLVSQGVGPERVVGVRMERSSATVVAFLAILKAGGVYLPLDPAYPSERLAFMIADAGAMLVLDSINGLDGDADLPQIGDPERLAYIIYTSGTTGVPKGVAVPHTAPVNLAFARRACHDPLGVGDRVLAGISVGFDVSIGQLLLPLLSGATVVIAGDLKTMGAGEFWSFLAERRVSHINSVPSFFESILDAAPPLGTLTLKRLMLGGEALSGKLVARIQSRLPGVEIVNMYGPTEACIDATFHVATAADQTAAVLPIGRPLPNYRAYILDERLGLAGIGIAGGLFLGGAGLAREYVNAPELTAERFISDPFSAGRLYRTGDRARWRADGEIEFLGRVDEQVKIRGFRVEPGEIEAQLRKQSGVREAAVIPQPANGGIRLIAYYTGEPPADLEALRAGMAAALPDYMVPSAFVKLARLPLSANGKLDRKALPNPEQSAFAARAFEPPIGEVEETMAALWADLLKLERVGRHDNFFELGGHSLLAMTLIERMRQQGLAGDVRALFGTPTIAALANAPALSNSQNAAPENLIAAGCETITPAMLPLVKLTQAQIDAIVDSVPGGAANVQDIYPLAPLQEGILFQHLMTEQGDPYLAPFLLGFMQRERLDSFIKALGQVVERHDVLRTAMVWKNVAAPLQVVLRQVNVPVEEVAIDTSASAPDAAAQLMTRFDSNVFRLDLSRAPLLRTKVAYDAAHDRWLLLMLTHHLILDHASLEIVVGELQALMANPQAALPEPVPYRNFVAQSRSSAPREEQQAFFASLLGGVDEPTAPFGLLDIQSSAKTVEGHLQIDAALAQRIRGQARALGVTAASLFHLAWAGVLSQLCGKSDVVFGTVLLGRMRSGAGANRAVGMFINTLPIRLTLGRTGVAESVGRTHELLAELMAHEHTPLALAQRSSAVSAPAPLFSSLFNYRYSAPREGEGQWAGVEMVSSSERTNYPLAMAVDDTGADFMLSALAHPWAHPQKACHYLEQSLRELVDLLERAPETPVETLEVLPSAERQVVTEEWNRTEAQFEEGTLEALFSAQAARTPHDLAVVGRNGEPLTYAELEAQSNQLARQLVAQGVGPERVVGVRMERSSETIIALLAILKAGGVYLPLDPAYPKERLDYMVADAGAMLVLESLTGLEGEADLPRLTDPNRLAYIIYTSGTTGRPKGVAVSHTAPVNLAFARRAAHDPIGVGDRVLAGISVGFDVSIGQLLLPLLSGAAVVIAGDLKAMSAGEFWEFLVRERVSHINSVPSFLDSILDAAPPPGTLALKRLMLGGEALSGALVSRIRRALPGVEVVNMYGPTETCIDATFHVATDDDLSAVVLPIGRPLANYRAYVLDHRLKPVGIGVPGELFLGGAGLARGYVNAPELTAERFIPDPFSTGRLYRTGDRARWREDGSLEFLGRVDEQVKIRGFRVEPAEIEAQMRRQPGIREAVVIAQPASGGTRLIAYYTGEQTDDLEALRAGMGAVLPDYMVPSAFVKLDQLPLSPNGKLDRKALPMDFVRAAEHAYEAPQDATQMAMQQIFQEVLGIHPIGIRDNFFALGGDSLAVMRLMNACNTRFKISLPLRTLFDDPTIEGLAARIASNFRESGSGHLIALQPAGQKPKLFCIHPAGGHVFCYLPLARALGLEQPVFALQASGLEEGESLAASIEQAAADYIQAIRPVQIEGPYQLLGMSSGGLIAYEMARQIQASGGEVSFLGLLDTTVPGSHDERILTGEYMARAMAGELGCEDLLDEYVKDGAQTPTLAELVEMGIQAGRLPAGFGVAQAERIANVFRNSVRLHSAYRPGGWSGRMLLVRALRRLHEEDAPPDWSPYVTGALEVEDLDCEHGDLVSSALSATVAAFVARQLN
jgi:amino acid adenylation domain-containing protein